MTVTSLFDKLWESHLIRNLQDGRGLIHIDRHLLHDLSSPQAFAGLRAAERPVVTPALATAVPDHIVDTQPGRSDATIPGGAAMITALRENARSNGIRLFDIGDPRQGIVHVVAAEQGIVLPGMTVACGDSHTCTLGALGSWAFGIGTSEVEHILATQTLVMKKPRSFRLHVTGRLRQGVTAKDLALGIIAKLGVNAIGGGVLELAGQAVSALSMEARFTLCNMGIEASARSAIIAPDDTSFGYVAQLPLASAQLAPALASWRRLRSDHGAAFDGEFFFDCDRLGPQLSWGTNPAQTVAVDQPIPSLAETAPMRAREAQARALHYMGLTAGQSLLGLPVQNVFIGSCTNSRLSDLQAAASLLRGRRIAPGIRALVVPGSSQVKRAAEALGLDRIFKDAGFEWRESGCSMCVGMNADRVPAGARCVSTSNRNFEGRQGRGARTHLASPLTAAAAAIAGCIADPRALAAS